MSKIKLLLVDDDSRIRSTLSAYLKDSGYEIITAAGCVEARKLNHDGIDLALIDLMMPDGSGLELVEQFRRDFPNQVLVMISGGASLADAVKAIKLGAVDFLEKPISGEKVEITISNALRLSALNRKLEDEAQKQLDRYSLIGDSPEMARVRHLIIEVSRTDSTVLLLGESGTGKEVAANLIHLNSKRTLKPFVAINAAAIPNELLESEMFGHEKGAFTGAMQRRIGKFEQASEGTLFLDEIAEMPVQLQAKLLRVIEEQKIERVGGDKSIDTDFRLVCATNRDLQKEIKEGRFRQDLFFRINVFAVKLPALREIPDDIKTIAKHHASRLCRKMGKNEIELSQGLLEALKEYHFPGNVRELRNILEHLLIMHRDGAITVEPLLPLLQSKSHSDAETTLKAAVARFEEEYISNVLKECRGNVTKAAEVLGLDRSYLYRKMKTLGFDE